VKKVLITLGAATLIVGGFLSIFASAYPDGLEWSMERVAGTTELEAEGPAFRSAEAVQEATAFMPDYGFPSEEEGSAAGTVVAGIVGSLLTCALAGLAGFVIWRVKAKRRAVLQ
jgi:cobalt/nickel transport system permease protein